MNRNLGWCSLVLLTLVACGGNKPGEVVTNSDPVAMRAAPAGTATLAFLDLETAIRPEALPKPMALPPTETAIGLSAVGTLPACIQSSATGLTTTFTFTNCKAASAGALNGTMAVTMALPSGGSTVYTQVFNLTATLDTTRSWHYTGTQTVTIKGSTAVVSSVPATAINVAFLDSATPANNKTYVFTPALAMNWSVPGTFTLDGSYSFARTGAETITATIDAADPLVWTASCDFPTSGTLGLAVTGPAGNANTNAIFGPVCGEMTISGGKLRLGSH